MSSGCAPLVHARRKGLMPTTTPTRCWGTLTKCWGTLTKCWGTLTKCWGTLTKRWGTLVCSAAAA
eukprot:4526451-Pyramimonas_sp.AAC.4